MKREENQYESKQRSTGEYKKSGDDRLLICRLGVRIQPDAERTVFGNGID